MSEWLFLVAVLFIIAGSGGLCTSSRAADEVDADLEPLEKLRGEHAVRLDRLVDGARLKQSVRRDKYLEDLKTLLAKSSIKQKPEWLELVDRERKAYQAGQTTKAYDPKDAAIPLELRKLRYYYDKESGAAMETSVKAVLASLKSYGSALVKLSKTKEVLAKPALAEAIKAEIALVKGRIGDRPGLERLLTPQDHSAFSASKEKPWENSLGLRFVPVPEVDPLFCIWETRVQDFEAFVAATKHNAIGGMTSSIDASGRKGLGHNWKAPGFPQTKTHPVIGVSWNDCKQFCQWLTEKETAEGVLPPGARYRFPTDLEWGQLVGLTGEAGKTPDERRNQPVSTYFWGDAWPPPKGIGNLSGEETAGKGHFSKAIEGYRDEHVYTAPVGSYQPDKHGLYDVSGNVYEWCEDLLKVNDTKRTRRGGGWVNGDTKTFLASARAGAPPEERADYRGFRLVLELPDREAGAQPPSIAKTGGDPKLPSPAVGPQMQKRKAAPGVFVRGGKSHAVHAATKAWVETPEGALRGISGSGYLFGDLGIGKGDFKISARLSLGMLQGTNARFFIGDGEIGLESPDGTLWTARGMFGSRKPYERTGKFITAGKPFLFEVSRTNDQLTVKIDGKVAIERKVSDGELGKVGFSPSGNTMDLFEFSASESLAKLPSPERTVAKIEGYRYFGNVSGLRTKGGDLMAFAYAIHHNDEGGDIIAVRSTDGGQTWSKPQKLASGKPGAQRAAYPSAILDRATGKIVVAYTKGKIKRQVFVIESSDDGVSWSSPRDVSEPIKVADWEQRELGTGIQILSGNRRKGRLVIPCTHVTKEGEHQAHTIYSDDAGKSWKLSQNTIPSGRKGSELIEMSDGKLMLSTAAGGNRKTGYRTTAFSSDGGETWSRPGTYGRLSDPLYRSAIARLGEFRALESRLLYAQPDVPVSTVPGAKNNLSIRVSDNEGKSWQSVRRVYSGTPGTSGLIPLDDQTVGLLYIVDYGFSEHRIAFRLVDLEWLESGK